LAHKLAVHSDYQLADSKVDHWAAMMADQRAASKVDLTVAMLAPPVVVLRADK